jgi:hypothetical protein
MSTNEYAIVMATIHAKMRIERAVPTPDLYATVDNMLLSQHGICSNEIMWTDSRFLSSAWAQARHDRGKSVKGFQHMERA